MINGEKKIEIGGSTSESSFIQGDVISSNVVSGRTSDSNLSTSGNITIDKRIVQNIPAEYVESLTELTKFLNKKIQEENISSQDTEPVQRNIDKLVKATADANLVEGVDENKKRSIRDRLVAVGEALANMSPTIAKAIISVTPLSAFSNLIGEAVGNIFQAAL